MSHNNPKSVNALMKYLRDEKGIFIAGGSQKRSLMNIGYYHGYKGYRYINRPGNQVLFSDFNELLAIYAFDTQLKTLFYPCVMRIETAIKNYVLEVIVQEAGSASFSDIYAKLLDNYKSFSTSGRVFKNAHDRKKAEDKFKYELKRRLDLRNRIYKVQTDAYGNNNKIAEHFLSKDINLPIWGIFELLSLGEFGHFVSCINQSCRAKISLKLGIAPGDDTNAIMPQRLIYATKDLRNSIAHNDVIFDTRFRTNNIDKQVSNVISNETGVPGLSFETITDYLVLIVYQLKHIGVTKTELKKLIANYTDIVEKLRVSIPASIFSQIIHTDNNTKVTALRIYI